MAIALVDQADISVALPLLWILRKSVSHSRAGNRCGVASTMDCTGLDCDTPGCTSRSSIVFGKWGARSKLSDRAGNNPRWRRRVSC